MTTVTGMTTVVTFSMGLPASLRKALVIVVEAFDRMMAFVEMVMTLFILDLEVPTTSEQRATILTAASFIPVETPSIDLQGAFTGGTARVIDLDAVEILVTRG